ncbi:DUF2171 domain-containing protein [Chloroflexota bacterium]
MEVEFGAKVIDRNGKELGTVDHLVRDTWSGEITKFIVRREAPDVDLFLSTKDVEKITGDSVQLAASLDELAKNSAS